MYSPAPTIHRTPGPIADVDSNRKANRPGVGLQSNRSRSESESNRIESESNGIGIESNRIGIESNRSRSESDRSRIEAESNRIGGASARLGSNRGASAPTRGIGGRTLFFLPRTRTPKAKVNGRMLQHSSSPVYRRTAPRPRRRNTPGRARLRSRQTSTAQKPPPVSRADRGGPPRSEHLHPRASVLLPAPVASCFRARLSQERHSDLARLLACRHCCGHGRLLEHGSITETTGTSHNVKCLAA